MRLLKDITANLIQLAEATPGTTQTEQLAGGMQVHVVVREGEVTLGVSRAGISPSQTEMITTLKHANAPEINRSIGKWFTGGKAGRLYVFTTWALPVRLEVTHD